LTACMLAAEINARCTPSLGNAQTKKNISSRREVILLAALVGSPGSSAPHGEGEE
jgi:hypothetical protein